jgi:hypothetical protein
VIKAQKGKIIHHYKNSKEKLLKTNAAIWFNHNARMPIVTCFIAVSFVATLVPAP